ncbi:MAG: DMT family transporter [Paracoccaceae bacterium]|nr:DMT family transporter [Paracoccaceae bacterium]
MSLASPPATPGLTGATARGILMMLLAVLGMTAMDAAAKELIGRYPTLQVVWARYIFQTLGVALWQARHLRRILRTAHPWLHVLRSLCQLGATMCFFASLRFVGLATATAIADMSPILITLGAALILRERIGPRRIAGVTVAFIGALIIIRPGSSVFSLAALLPLAAATCFAGYALITRYIGAREPVWTALIYATMIGSATTTALLPGVWQPIAWGDLPIFVLIGSLGVVAQVFMIRAYSLAEASVIAPFGQADLIFAAMLGLVFFGEFPDGWTIVGALVIAGAGLYVWHRETRAARAGQDG